MNVLSNARAENIRILAPWISSQSRSQDLSAVLEGLLDAV
jgi:hypothetical protein